jgi:ABC-2 type transport system permease protein
VLGSVAVGMYQFGVHSLNYITTEPYLRDALPLYIYELFFLIITGLVFFSAITSALLKFFTRDRVAWIMVTPRFSMQQYHMLSGIFMTSLWPLLIAGLPMLFAIQKVFHLSAIGFVLALCMIIVLVACGVLGAMACLLIAAKLLYQAHSLTKKTIVITVLCLMTFLAFGTWNKVGRSNALQLFRANDLTLQVARLEGITSQFNIFPSHQVALTLHGLTHHQSSLVVQSIAILMTELCALMLLVWLCLAWYLDLWKALQESQPHMVRAAGVRKASQRPFPRFLHGVIGSIFEKEALMLYRNASNALWFCFVLLLWLIQTSLNFYARRTIDASGVEGAFPTAIEAFQVLAAVFFVTAFVLRFAFPSFSTERKTAWILASAPIRMRTLFWSKCIFYIPVFVVLALILGVVNTTLVPIPLTAFIVFLSFIAVSTLTVTALGLSLGAFFPNFETDDPEIISTSLPGLFFTIAAIGYGILGAALFNFFLMNGSLLPVVLFQVLSCVLAIVLLRFAAAALEHIDFA